MHADNPDYSKQFEEVTIRILRKAKRHPVPLKRLQKEIARMIESCRPTRILSVLATHVASGTVMVFGDDTDSEYFWTGNFECLKVRLCAIVRSYHTRYPYERGMSAGEIRKNFSETQTLNANRNIDARLFELAMLACKQDGRIVEADCGVRLSKFTPRSKKGAIYKKMEEDILVYANKDRCACFDFEALSRQLGVDARQAKTIVSEMMWMGRLVEIDKDCYLEPSVIDEVKNVLTVAFCRRPRLRPGEITVLLGQSRRTTIPLLGYFDRIGFTRRDGKYRQLASTEAGDRLDSGSFGAEGE